MSSRLKQRIRVRMAQTGESWSQAKAWVRAQETRPRMARTRNRQVSRDAEIDHEIIEADIEHESDAERYARELAREFDFLHEDFNRQFETIERATKTFSFFSNPFVDTVNSAMQLHDATKSIRDVVESVKMHSTADLLKSAIGFPLDSVTDHLRETMFPPTNLALEAVKEIEQWRDMFQPTNFALDAVKHITDLKKAMDPMGEYREQMRALKNAMDPMREYREALAFIKNPFDPWR